MLEVENVEFDPENPRISQYLATYTNPDPETVAMALQPGDTKYLELKQAIKTNDGIINPIIVNKAGGKFVSIEGNTRLAIYKQFNKENPKDGRWIRIPAVVYEDMTPKAIDAVRLQAHLVGVRNWTPYAKAKYLYSLHECEYLPINELVEFCGGNKLDVLRNIEAFKQMEHAYRPLIPGDEFDQHKFSNFLEAQRPQIRNAMMSSGFKDSDFAKWVRDGKFEPRQELVRKLPAILSNHRAKQVFIDEGADKAINYIDRPEIAKELQNATLVDLCDAVQEKINNLTLKERDDIRINEDYVQSIDDTLEYLRNFFTNEIQ